MESKLSRQLGIQSFLHCPHIASKGGYIVGNAESGCVYSSVSVFMKTCTRVFKLANTIGLDYA